MNAHPANVADPAVERLDGSAGERVIPVIEERLQVSRRSVETGHATRVRKRVRESIEDLDLTSWHEEVLVERVPVGRVVDGPLATRQEGDVLVIPIVEERVVVRTERVLREEIRITRRWRAERQVQAVRLRSETAIVERLDPATGEWTEIEAEAVMDGHAVDDPAGPQHEASREAPVEQPIVQQPPPRS